MLNLAILSLSLQGAPIIFREVEAPPSPPDTTRWSIVPSILVLVISVLSGIAVHILDRLLSRPYPSSHSEGRLRWFKTSNSFFHWHPSAGIPLLVGGGMTLAVAQQYGMACACLVVAGVWGLGCWLTSERLQRKRRELGRFLAGHSAEALPATRRYHAEQYGVSVLVTFATVAAVIWVLHAKMRLESEDVTEHMIAEVDLVPADNPYRSLLSLTNNSNSDVLRESIRIYPKTMSVGHLEWILLPHQPFIVADKPLLLEKHGGHEGSTFLPQISTQPLACADVTVAVDYSLPSWTFRSWKNTETLTFRFVTRWSPDGLHWVKQPASDKRNFCFDKQFHSPYGNTF